MFAAAAAVANELDTVDAAGFEAAIVAAVNANPVAVLRGAAKIARARAGWRIFDAAAAERQIAIATLLEAAAASRDAAAA